ncbi:MAG: DUF4340 domain-containing protein [Longimicrobiales bacterium]
MSDRLVKNLVIALAILAAGYGIVRVIAGRASGGPSASFNLASLAEVEIDSVHIVSASDTIRLGGGSEWTVNGYEAIPESGDAFSRALEQTRVGEVVSRNPENHRRLGIADGQGRVLTIYAGDAESMALLISDKGQTFDDAYVRRLDDAEVRVVRGNLVDLVRRNVEGWRNKQILGLTADDIQRLEFSFPDEEFAAVRDSTGWHFEPSGATASADIDRVVREVASLRGIGFAPDAEADTLSWESPAGGVILFGPGGAELGEVSFLARSTSGYFVRLAGKPVVFTLSQYSGDQVLKRETELTESPE